jgi:hypothetical protein
MDMIETHRESRESIASGAQNEIFKPCRGSP